MKLKVFFSTLFLLAFSTLSLFAQPGEPCNGNDPDAYCPLDTWVLVLAGVALLFAALHLHRKQAALAGKLQLKKV